MSCCCELEDSPHGVSKDDGTVRAPLDEQLAAMDRAMMCRAQRQEIPDRVQTTIGSRLDVVHVDEGRMGATGDLAAVVIARENGPAQGRWDALSGARAWIF